MAYGLLMAMILMIPGYLSPESVSSAVPRKSRQMILVITPSNSAFQGQLYRFERAEDSASWRALEGAVPAVVGKNGLGWGSGLHKEKAPGIPPKQEGDGKSPAGAFRLSAVFGYAPEEQMSALKIPYLHVSETLECIDDRDSRYYNLLVRREEVEQVDWHSSEKMRAVGREYQLGVVVDHNTLKPQPGAGSCIFLHIWKDASEPTTGCTAMAPRHMERIAFWLDSHKQPALVQLTDSLYHHFKRAWNLPDLPGK